MVRPFLFLKLEQEAEPRGCGKLSGQERYRLRRGRYRIIYSIQDEDRQFGWSWRGLGRMFINEPTARLSVYVRNDVIAGFFC